jgi:hypothetical protein
VTYEVSGDPVHQALCHCTDCQRHAGAPMVGWALFPNANIKIEGETKEYRSSENGRRHFCPNCGTPLFYTNAVIFPDQTDVQIATLDDPNALEPQGQIQTAERIGWMEKLDQMPQFERYPGM